MEKKEIIFMIYSASQIFFDKKNYFIKYGEENQYLRSHG